MFLNKSILGDFEKFFKQQTLIVSKDMARRLGGSSYFLGHCCCSQVSWIYLLSENEDESEPTLDVLWWYLWLGRNRGIFEEQELLLEDVWEQFQLLTAKRYRGLKSLSNIFLGC
ncbi:hypothetical protein Syun_025368 [Stephania yunnanensis]|uniref:Uncharacterized protein n=1 Tax=Stephania yunnanensis TaxID=152371 RepID=A0AAP0HR75_9MAGN